MNQETISSEAKRILQHAVVWDNVWPWEPWCGNDFDKLARFRNAGVNVLSITIAGDNHDAGTALKRVAQARRLLQSIDKVKLAESIADVKSAAASGDLAVTLHFEGTRCLDRDIGLIESFYKLGVRHNLLAFNQTNSAGGGCGEAGDGGLSRYGATIVREMERVGMLLDLSHTGYVTSMDAIAIATKPVVFTHSNAHAIAPHWRNLRNDQIDACAATGGLVGVSSSSAYLGEDACTPEALFRHVDYFVQRVGAQHVGLGLDIVFDGAALSDWARGRPDEWPGADDPDWPGFQYGVPEQIAALTDRMLAAGYNETDIVAILGGNYMRICGEVWK